MKILYHSHFFKFKPISFCAFIPSLNAQFYSEFNDVGDIGSGVNLVFSENHIVQKPNSNKRIIIKDSSEVIIEEFKNFFEEHTKNKEITNLFISTYQITSDLFDFFIKCIDQEKFNLIKTNETNQNSIQFLRNYAKTWKDFDKITTRSK